MTTADLRNSVFTAGQPSGVRNVVRDSAGRLTAWVENGFTMTLTRDTAGNPLRLVAQSGQTRLQQVFGFDAAGRLVTTSGHVIPTVMAGELAAPAQQAVQALVSGYVVRRPRITVRCDTMADYTAWANWFGRPPDAVHAFAFSLLSGNPNGTPWSLKLRPWADQAAGALAESNKFPGIPLDWCVPLCTDTQPLEDTAAGTYDKEINAMLDVCLAHVATGKVRIRFGHEAGFPNGGPWAACRVAGDEARFIAAFDHMATLVRAKSDRFIIDWCNSQNSYRLDGTIIDPRTFAPADSSYDAISVDLYAIGGYNGQAYTLDRFSGRTPYFNSNAVIGLGALRDHAVARGKRVRLSEWGVGAENPAHIRDVWDFIQDPKNNCDEVGYWNKNAPSGAGPYDFPCRLTPDSGNNYPLTSQVFLDLFGPRGSTSYAEQSITSSWLSRVITPPTTERRAAYDALIFALARCGSLARMDELFVLAAHSAEQAAISPILGGSWNTTSPTATGRLVLTGTATFVADRGYTGDGSTGILTCGINLSTGTNRKMSQNDVHLGAFTLTKPNTGVQSALVGIGNFWLGKNASDRWAGCVASGSQSVLDASAGTGPGHMMWNRTGPATWASYFNGAQAATGTTTSAAIGSDNLRICGVASVGYSQAQIAIVHVGASLTDAQIAATYAAFAAYLSAIGAV